MKSFEHSAKIGCLALLAAFAPGLAMAQDACPANLVVQIDSDKDIFAIGENIPIRVELRMGESGVEPGEVTAYISQFRHLLDCEPGVDVETCIADGGVPGNVVNFVEGSETTDCVVDDPPFPPPGASTVDGNVDGLQSGIEVDFTFTEALAPMDPSAVVLDSVPDDGDDLVDKYNFCTTKFDVVVEALGTNSATLDVVEFTGFTTDWAVCNPEDEDPVRSSSFGQIGFNIANPNTIIWVTKDFTDDNDDEVDVHLRCDAGTVLNPDFTGLTDPATDGTFETVGFVVYNIPSIGANCRVYEEPVPSGYTATYEADVREAAEGDYEDFGSLEDNQGCYFSKVKGGEYECEVTNTPKPAEFTAYKEWIINGEGGHEVLQEAQVTISCDREIYETVLDDDSDENEVAGIVIPPGGLQDDWLMVGTLGDGEFMTARVDTITDEAECFATEKVEASGVESVDDCGKVVSLGPGESSECTFTNTVFFEGIPTLNQYGLALMMLLMLGLGALSYRRLG